MEIEIIDTIDLFLLFPTWDICYIGVDIHRRKTHIIVEWSPNFKHFRHPDYRKTSDFFFGTLLSIEEIKKMKNS